jgi:E3 ubiquitin-protein ligase UBR4
MILGTCAFDMCVFQVTDIRRRLKQSSGSLIEMLLCDLLALQALVIQKTKLTLDCANDIAATLNGLAAESEADQCQLIAACIKVLQERRDCPRMAPLMLRLLRSYMCPSKAEPVYQLMLNKAPSQEEFIRGCMTKNPYSSAEIGTVMRDIKRKVCEDLDMRSLMDDDNGMELLVNGSIIALSLPIRLVYEQVWRTAHGGQAMIVVYRLQGLDGEATEPFIDTLADTKVGATDSETEYKLTGVMASSGGLASLLQILSTVTSLDARPELATLLVETLHDCCQLAVNRTEALSLGALNLVLAKVLEALPPANTPVCATGTADYKIAEMLLSVLLLLATHTAHDTQAPTLQHPSPQQLHALAERLSSPAVVARRFMCEIVARVLPLLTLGDDVLLDALVDAVLPHLNASLDDHSMRTGALTPQSPSTGPVAGPREKGKMMLLDGIVDMAAALGQEPAAMRMRDRFCKLGVVRRLAAYLSQNLPEPRDDTSQEER